jgi:hypothetical protein
MISKGETMFLLLLSAFTFASTQTTKFYGTAKDPKGNIAYLEEHEVIYENGTVKSSTTTYTDEAKKPIASLISLYSPHKWMPTYNFKDLRHGTYNGVNATVNEIEMFTQEDKKLKNKKKPFKPDMIGGQGFHYFIQDHLDKLAKGEKVKTKFVLPGALDYYSFVIQKSDKKKVKDSEIYLVMKLDSMLSVFISPIFMTYDIPTKRLMGYEGESNLQDKDKKAIVVDIVYKHD